MMEYITRLVYRFIVKYKKKKDKKKIIITVLVSENEIHHRELLFESTI